MEPEFAENNKQGSSSKRAESCSSQGNFLTLWVRFCNFMNQLLPYLYHFSYFCIGVLLLLSSACSQLCGGKDGGDNMSLVLGH